MDIEELHKIELIQAAAEHWERLRDGKRRKALNEKTNWQSCPLCVVYLDDFHECDLCPIADMGFDECGYTPYRQISSKSLDAIPMADHDKSTCKKMVNFLETGVQR